MNRKIVLTTIVMLATVLALAGCSGGKGGGGAPTPDPAVTPSSGSTIRLSGQVAVGSSQLAAAGFKADKAARGSIRFATAAANPFASANVSLYKMMASGSKELVSGVSAVTDALGNYTLEGVPAVQTGTGAATDFYYEVRAAAGSIEVSAPAAPTADATVNVSPETKIAAAMISDVARVQGVSAAQVLPSDKVIDILRDRVYADVNQMSTFTLPPMEAGAESKVVIAASAVSSNSSDSEKLMRAYETLKEALYLQQNRADVAEARIAAYLDRAMKSACNFHPATRLPLAARDALAAAFKNGTTFTPAQIAAADNRPGVDENSLVAAYNNVLTSLNTALTSSAPIPDSDLLGIYASRGDLRSIGTGSSLQADQALVLLQIAGQANQPQNQPQPVQICQAPLDFMKIAAALTGNSSMTTTPSFSDVEVYHSRMQCPDGPPPQGAQPQATLEAKVRIYAPQGTEVTGVTISASGMTNKSTGQPVSSLNFGPHNFPGAPSSPGFSDWVSEQACLNFDQTYNYTITATLTSGDPITTQVSRTIVNVPEARITLMAKDYSETAVFFQPGTGQPNNPIKLTAAQSTRRPLFKWAPKPGDAQTDAQVPGAPAGSQIKYLFDVSHFDISQGGPDNNCPVFQNNDKYFEKDYIISPIDCNVDECNTATGREHACRIHVQTVLVDEFDRTLGWSAGGNLYYCIEGQINCQQ